MEPRDAGRAGEEIAAGHLERAGWRILDRNYRAGHKELDLVAVRGEVLAFVEVKTRTSLGFGHPLEAVTRRKRAEVTYCARAWLRAHPRAPGVIRRFDAVAVLLADRGRIRVEHVEDAWRAGE